MKRLFLSAKNGLEKLGFEREKRVRERQKRVREGKKRRESERKRGGRKCVTKGKSIGNKKRLQSKRCFHAPKIFLFPSSLLSRIN